MTNKYDGNFIVTEGIDGSSKSTQINFLKDFFPNFYYTREPDILRDHIFNGDYPPLGTLHLFLADRLEHNENYIIPKLKKGETVICDRYYLSTLAYQREALKSSKVIPINNIDNILNDYVSLTTVEPDLMLLFDCDVSTAMERTTKDGEDKYENTKFLECVRKNYLEEYDKRDNVIKIDTMNGRYTIFNTMMNVLKDNFSESF